jgi:hypothetical protein
MKVVVSLWLWLLKESISSQLRFEWF